jgi:phage terminase small subunit
MARTGFRRAVKNNLTAKQLLFIDNYLADPELNATAAFRAAGYRGIHSATGRACLLLKNPRVKAEIARRMEKIHGSEKDNTDKAKRVIEELELLAFNDPADFFKPTQHGLQELKTIHEMGAVRRAISSIKVSRTADGQQITEIKIRSKEKALELLGKHHQLYSEILPKGQIIRPIILPDNGKSKPFNAVIEKAG